MRFKYYLRGAGIGVIAATLILSIAFLFHDNISDEEVIRRAMKLGMVMQENGPGTLADPPVQGDTAADLQTGTDLEGSTKTDEDPLTDPDQSASDPDSTDPDLPDPGSADPKGQDQTDPNPAGSGEDASDQNPPDQTSDDPSSEDHNADSPDSKPDDEKDKPPKKKPDKDTDAESSDEVEIVIESGDVSRMVSAKVHEAGLVEDAEEFNSYLGAHDYDNMLQPGSYKIKKGSSFRQIAQILTRQ